MQLLLGSDAFWRRAQEDIARAQRRLFVQAMTFEGDRAGRSVADAIADSPAASRRVLVDDYTFHVVSDHNVRGPWARMDAALRAEVRATAQMFDRLTADGVEVRVTNPIGRLRLNYPARNHKKMIIADNVAYLGGINFSDHNFAWRDLMLRLEHPGVSDFLAADFAATFAGKGLASAGRWDGVELICADGRTNAASFRPVLDMIAAARREVVVVSAYLTFPFTNALALAAARGVRVRLITPWANNKRLVRDYLVAKAERAGFEVALTPGMSHLKGLLVDDRTLVLGSSNFDFVSLAAEEEFLAIVTAPPTIADFRARVMDPALAEAASHGIPRVSRTAGVFAEGVLRAANRVAIAARGARRTAVDWA